MIVATVLPSVPCNGQLGLIAIFLCTDCVHLPLLYVRCGLAWVRLGCRPMACLQECHQACPPARECHPLVCPHHQDHPSKHPVDTGVVMGMTGLVMEMTMVAMANVETSWQTLVPAWVELSDRILFCVFQGLTMVGRLVVFV